MFSKIVVGVDEHTGSRDAIALAKNLLASNGRLSLVHVLTHKGYGYRGPGAAYEAFALQSASEALERTRAQAEVDAQILWRESASVGRGLHELCEEVGADLLVVGSSRRGPVGRVLIRDDTRAAINAAPCAIAIAPPHYSQEPIAMREIGVGYDGSPESKHALEEARRLSAETGAKLSAFEAVVLPVFVFSASRQLLKDAIEAVLTEARDEIGALGGVEPHVAFGDAAEELALYSASLDLLIVGSRGYGPVGRLIHGSTSGRLAHMARCPLLVLPRSAPAPDARGAGRAETEALLTSQDDARDQSEIAPPAQAAASIRARPGQTADTKRRFPITAANTALLSVFAVSAARIATAAPDVLMCPVAATVAAEIAADWESASPAVAVPITSPARPKAAASVLDTSSTAVTVNASRAATRRSNARPRSNSGVSRARVAGSANTSA